MLRNIARALLPDKGYHDVEESLSRFEALDDTTSIVSRMTAVLEQQQRLLHGDLH
jgi:hypothetical protein